MNREHKFARASKSCGYLMSEDKVSRGRPFDKNDVGLGAFEYLHEEQLPKGFLKYFKYLMNLKR